MCMLDYAEGNVYPIGEAAHPKAMLPHKCAECHRVIERGEKYLLERFIWDGKFEIHKTCSHCEVARAWLADECGGWLYGGVEEDLREHCHERGYGMDLYRVAVGIAWKWRTPSGRLLPVPAMPKTGHEIAALAAKAS